MRKNKNKVLFLLIISIMISFNSCNFFSFYKKNSEKGLILYYRIYSSQELNLFFNTPIKIKLPIFENINYEISNNYSSFTPFDNKPFNKKIQDITYHPVFIEINIEKIDKNYDIIDLINLFNNGYLYITEEKNIYKSLNDSEIKLIEIYTFNYNYNFKIFLSNFINLNNNKKLEIIQKYKNSILKNNSNLHLNFGYLFLIKNDDQIMKDNLLIFTFEDKIIKIKLIY
jgi:hypothetical protein